MTRHDFLPALRSILTSVVLLLTAGATHLLQVSNVQGQPVGRYTVITRPFLGTGYENLPVLVTSVTTEKQFDGGVANVGVENGTSLRLEAVRLIWYLSTQEAPGYVLLQGKTPMLRLPGGIAAGSVERIEYPVASFAKLTKSLARKGSVRGNYLLQIGVSEARFDDGTVQSFLAGVKKSSMGEVSFVNASWASRRAAPRQGANCPNQARTPTYEQQGETQVLTGYGCSYSQGSTCTNQAGGRSCTVTVCGKEGGGPKPPIVPIRD